MSDSSKFNTKSTKEGLCNICGKYSTLTEDHVPPKGSVKPQKIRIKSISQYFDKVDLRIARLSQNGVKFQSLCAKCNNERLGSNFDLSLNSFSHNLNEFIEIINANELIILPSEIDFKIQPQRLARSIIGHLLAVEIRKDMAEPLRTAPMVTLMRKYFLDETLDFPDDLNLYVWPYYIAERQVVLRGIGIGCIEQNDWVMGDVIKYYPIAFWLTYKAPKEKIIDFLGNQLFSEIPVRGHNLDEWNTVSINLATENTIRSDWPEAPNDTEFLLVTNSVCFVAEATTEQ